MSSKFVAVLNKTVDLSRALNALGHVTAGLAGNTGQSERMEFITYKDKSGASYPNISRCPYIVLKGADSKLRQFRDNLIEHGIPYSCFLDTMIEGGSDQQVENTAKMASEELKIIAIVTFADRDVLDPLTKKFSMWTYKTEEASA